MTHRYRITLHSPMGPREGELSLTGEMNGTVTGVLSLLGFQQPVSGRESSGHIQLQHRLRTAMQELDCVSLLELTGETITGVTHTDKGSIHWTGVRQPD